MNFSVLAGKINISSRKFLSILFLFFSTFSWFFFFMANYKFSNATGVGYQVLGFRDTSFALGEGIFLSFIVAFMVAGSLIAEKHDRRKLLLSWTLLGVGSSILAGVFEGTPFSFISSALLGTSFGLSFPLVAAFMNDSTVVEERARISGIVLFLSFIVAIVATAFATSVSSSSVIVISIILQSLALPALFFDPVKRSEGKKHSWKNILTYRQFIFYILPCLMFTIVSGLLNLIQTQIPKEAEFTQATSTGNIFHLVGTALFALMAGFAADRFGRRKPIMIGLVMLGISSAILGVAVTPLTWLTYLVISGFAYGIVFVIYFAIPGDLAFLGSQERFYALGTGVPFIAYTSITGPAQLMGFSLPLDLISPILTVVTFISIIPLIYASETLPENKILEKQLKDHIKKVQKMVEESNKS